MLLRPGEDQQFINYDTFNKIYNIVIIDTILGYLIKISLFQILKQLSYFQFPE